MSLVLTCLSLALVVAVLAFLRERRLRRALQLVLQGSFTTGDPIPMTRHVLLRIPLLTILLCLTGCDRDERLARFAEQAVERQAEQNRRMAELQQEVAEGSRQLVEADAKARSEFTELHRDLQSERSEIGQQRDALEEERRAIVRQRVTDPLVAAAILESGVLLACLLPLVLCWYLLRQGDSGPADALVTEILLEDLTKDRPLLLAPPAAPPLLTTNSTEGPRPTTRIAIQLNGLSHVWWALDEERILKRQESPACRKHVVHSSRTSSNRKPRGSSSGRGCR